MLNKNAFYRFIMFFNDNIENVIYISKPQRNQLIIDFTQIYHKLKNLCVMQQIYLNYPLLVKNLKKL